MVLFDKLFYAAGKASDTRAGCPAGQGGSDIRVGHTTRVPGRATWPGYSRCQQRSFNNYFTFVIYCMLRNDA